MDVGAIATLRELGVQIAWIPRMEHTALYLPQDCILILNASHTRDEINAAVEEILPEARQLADSTCPVDQQTGA